MGLVTKNSALWLGNKFRKKLATSLDCCPCGCNLCGTISDESVTELVATVTIDGVSGDVPLRNKVSGGGGISFNNFGDTTTVNGFEVEIEYTCQLVATLQERRISVNFGNADPCEFGDGYAIVPITGVDCIVPEDCWTLPDDWQDTGPDMCGIEEITICVHPP